MNSIISWNVNSIRSKLPYVQLLCNELSPTILCAQETKLTPNDTFKMKHFSIFRHDKNSPGNAKGGVLIAVTNKIHAEIIPLTTPFQAVAIRAYLSIPITICTIYLHHQDAVTTYDLENLIHQLPAPFIITGDWNAHNQIWGSTKTDSRGTCIENLMNTTNIALLNTGESTRFDIYSGNLSAIDLTFCSPSLLTRVCWTIQENFYASDHFPQRIDIITPTKPPNETYTLKWQLRKAQWDLYTTNLDFSNLRTCETADQMLQSILTAIHSAALTAIPLIQAKRTKLPVPWWNEDCAERIKRKRKLWREYRKRPSEENLNAFKIARAQARRSVYESKRNSWRTFISDINRNTPSSLVWSKIRKLTNKKCYDPIPAIRDTAGQLLTSTVDIADTLADFYYNNMKQDDPSPCPPLLNMGSDNPDICAINCDITVWEVSNTTSKLKKTAPGPDCIYSDMLKHLNQNHLQEITSFFNHIWRNHDFPSKWREATIIPILKPGKDRTFPTNYRPISLTNILCKTLEKIVTNRLHQYLQSHKILDNSQCGFQPNKSTTDNLVHLTEGIELGFSRKQDTIAVFFDVEKAFDRLRPHSILQAFHEMQLNGHIINFVKNFLEERTFQVRIGETLSNTRRQETGTPQGSVLSPLLFIMAVNGIKQCIEYPVQHLMYADDLVIYTRGTQITNMQHVLQCTISKLTTWADKLGLRFAPSKTKLVHFTRKRSLPTIHLTLCNEQIQQSQVVKFLGVTLEQKLHWKSHIATLLKTATQRLNIMKITNGTAWGADKHSLLQVYRSHIRSVIDYGSIIYRTANTNTLKKLDTIQNQALRIATGALRTSPILSIHAETNFLPLTHHRNSQILNYYGRVIRTPFHINAYYVRSPQSPKGLAATVQKLLNIYKISPEDYHSASTPRSRKNLISHSIRAYLQTEWETKTVLLKTIKPELSQWKTTYIPHRQSEKVLARVRIGHTHLTHNYIFTKQDPPLCDKCYVRLDVLHLLNYCVTYDNTRKATYGDSPYPVYESLTDSSSNIQLFLKFLNETNLLPQL